MKKEKFVAQSSLHINALKTAVVFDNDAFLGQLCGNTINYHGDRK